MINNQGQRLTPEQQHVVYRLEHELVAPCCYSQVVADHMSGEAVQMRHEIVQMVLEGRAEQQIVDGYKARYGEVILAAPDGVAGAVAFAFPPLIFVAGLIVIAALLHRWLSRDRRQRMQLIERHSVPVLSETIERIRLEIGDF